MTTARRQAEALLGRWAALADEAAAAAARGDEDAMDAALAGRDALCTELARALAGAGRAPSTAAALAAAAAADDRLGAALVARRADLEAQLAEVAQQQLAAEAYQPAGATSRLDVRR